MTGFGGETTHESRKKVTAVFADMVGSTRLAESLDPEFFRQVMSGFFERLTRAVERHGGTVENLIGDEIAGIFGAPVSHGDDAMRAVRAAIDMLSEVESLSDEIEQRVGVRLAIRVGINTGTVVVGPPIAGRSMSLGDTMNVAARLEKLAEPGQILFGESTYALVRRDVEVEPTGTLELRGRSEPTRTYLLRGMRSEDIGEPLADRPILGRERDLALMAVAFERAVARSACEFVTVMGEAGVGKSRLVVEVIERYRSRATVLVGRCLPYGEGITYWPLLEIVQQAAGVDDSDDAETGREKLKALLQDDPESDALTRHLAQIIGLDDSFEPGEQVFWAVRRLVEALARRGPLILWFEDLQWAEPTLLDLIVHLSRTARALPILLAGTARFELLAKRPDWREVCPTTISLEALRDVEVKELIQTLTGHTLPDALQGRIREVAAGNPLFVEQILSMLIDDGWLVRDGDGWAACEGSERVSVPPTIEAILASRIDHLALPERSLAEAASVIGREFSAEEALTLDPEAAAPSIDALVRKRLIEPVRHEGTPAGLFRFRHLLVRDAVYESLSKSRRAALHERFADDAVARAGTRLAQIEGLIGYHLETAYRCRAELLGGAEQAESLARRAASHLASAGRRAAARQDDGAAAGLLGRAVALLAHGGSGDPQARLEPLIELGMTLVRGGETDRANQVLAEARRTAVSAGDSLSEARIRILEVSLKRLIDPPWWEENGRAVAEGALATFREEGFPLDEARALHLIGKFHSDRGQQAAAAESLERALELARGAGDSGVEAWVRYWLLQVSSFGPAPCGRVIARARDDLEWARAHDNRALEGSTLGNMGEMLARSGKVEEAGRAFAQAQAAFEELDLPVHVAYLALSRAAVEPLASDHQAAERELRSAATYFEEAGALHIVASLLPMLASALARQGRLDEALALSERTEEIAATNDVDAQVKWRVARSEALTGMNRLADAERYAREAVAMTEPSDMVVLKGSAQRALAEVLLAQRSSAEASESLEEALGLYESKGDVVSAGRVRETLNALEGSPFI